MNSSTQQPKILIVEDEKALADVLDDYLRHHHFVTRVVEDGALVQDIVAAFHPDLILLDLMLPRAGGFEIVRELQQEPTDEIPIVIMTGRMMDRSTSEMIKQERNVKEYLEKPIKTELLAALLHRLLKTRPQPRRPGPR